MGRVSQSVSESWGRSSLRQASQEARDAAAWCLVDRGTSLLSPHSHMGKELHGRHQRRRRRQHHPRHRRPGQRAILQLRHCVSLLPSSSTSTRRVRREKKRFPPSLHGVSGEDGSLAWRCGAAEAAAALPASAAHAFEYVVFSSELWVPGGEAERLAEERRWNALRRRDVTPHPQLWSRFLFFSSSSAVSRRRVREPPLQQTDGHRRRPVRPRADQSGARPPSAPR